MRIVFKALTGSHCQGLDTENSDKDFKCLALPDPKEIVCSRLRGKNRKSEDGSDYDIHDIRDFPELMRKSNPTYLEILFPEFYEFDVNFDPIFRLIFDNRNRIARMNPPALFKALNGMYENRYKRMYEDLGKNGYNGKNACHALRCCMMTQEFYNNGFEDFGKCVKLPEVERGLLLKVKREEQPLINVENFLAITRDNMLALEPEYTKQPFDKEMNDLLEYELNRWVWDQARKNEFDYRGEVIYPPLKRWDSLRLCLEIITKKCDNCKFFQKVDAKKFYCLSFCAYFLEKKDVCEEFRKKKS